jgi:hypothetical protein
MTFFLVIGTLILDRFVGFDDTLKDQVSHKVDGGFASSVLVFDDRRVKEGRRHGRMLQFIPRGPSAAAG